MSLLLVAGSLSYVFGPVQEALGTAVATVASKSGHEAIEGRVQSSSGGIFKIEVIKRSFGRNMPVATVKIRRYHRFYIWVRPGRYLTIIRHHHHQVALHVRVTKGHSIFIVIKTTVGHGGLAIVPVIFNY